MFPGLLESGIKLLRLVSSTQQHLELSPQHLQDRGNNPKWEGDSGKSSFCEILMQNEKRTQTYAVRARML
jgi:hypothetical protein